MRRSSCFWPHTKSATSGWRRDHPARDALSKLAPLLLLIGLALFLALAASPLLGTGVGVVLLLVVLWVAGFATVLLGWSKLMLAEEFAADRTAVRALAGLSHDAVAVAAAALRQPWMQSADLGLARVLRTHPSPQDRLRAIQAAGPR